MNTELTTGPGEMQLPFRSRTGWPSQGSGRITGNPEVMKTAGFLFATTWFQAVKTPEWDIGSIQDQAVESQENMCPVEHYRDQHRPAGW